MSSNPVSPRLTGDEDKPLLSKLRLLVSDEVEREFLRIALENLREEEIAEALVGFKIDDKLEIFNLLDDEKAAAVLSETDEESQRDLLDNLDAERVAELLTLLPPDDNVDILEIIEEEDKQQLKEVLGNLPQEIVEEIQPLSKYSSDTAGGIMTSDFVALTEFQPISAMLDKMRDADDDVNISIVFAIDTERRLTGTLSFREVIKATPDNLIQNIMNKDVIAVTPDADQEYVVSLMKKYDLTLMPVVDETSKLIGVVTFDDAMDVLSEEAEEDIALLSGSLVYDPVQSKVFTRIWLRLPWLVVSLFGTFLAAWVLKSYEATIEQITAAVFFIPAVTAMSGNVGIQSSTTLVRGLALGQVDFSMIFKLISKEIRTAFLIGIICGSLITVFSYLLNSTGWNFGIIVGIAMILSVSVSAIVGTVIPLICDKFKIDPAVAAGPFITTLNDIITMIIYMSIITFGIANKFL